MHILTDGPDPIAQAIIAEQRKVCAVEVIDLKEGNVSYEELVDRIFACDKVVSW